MSDPVVLGDLLFFHELQPDQEMNWRPRLFAYDYTDPNQPILETDGLSDPMPLEGSFLVRRWEENNEGELRPRVERRFVDQMETSGLVQGPLGLSGVPRASALWAAWTIGENRGAIWAVPMGDLTRGGFQLPLPEGRYDVIALVGENLIYQDFDHPDQAVSIFDLNLGQSRVWAEGVVPGSFRISTAGERALWRTEESGIEVLRVELNFLSSLGD